MAIVMQARTDKLFKNLASFSKEVMVSCPNCHKRALVTSELSEYNVPYPTNAKSKFACNNCYKPINQNEWLGPINLLVSTPCSKCGNRIEHVIKSTREYKEQLEVKCEVCNEVRAYKTTYELTYSNNKQATDPYFGLPLWLQIPIKNEILWAYNYDHLNYLKKYVSAKLREAASGGKYALTWRLPNFIKDAKNRDRILRSIQKLEAKKNP